MEHFSYKSGRAMHSKAYSDRPACSVTVRIPGFLKYLGLIQRIKFVCVAMCSLVSSRLTGLTCSNAPGIWMVEHQLVS